MAFFSRDLYRDAARHWGGLSFLYLGLLLAVTWVPVMVAVDATFDRLIAEEAPKFVEQIPTIVIRDGRVSVDVQQPYCVNHPETGECLAMIDTTGATTSLKDSEAKILLTESSLVIAGDSTKTEAHSLDAIEELTIDQDAANGILAFAGRFLAVLLYPLVVLFSFGYRVTLTLLYGVAGLALAKTEGIKLSFGSLCSLSIMAMTPAILIQTVLDTAGSQIPKAHLIFLAVALIYLLFGIRACAQPQAPGQPRIEH
jgi:hypothetical protein